MHELKIAEELVEIVIKVAESENLKKVTRVNILFGKMIMIVPDVFQFVFESAIKGTIAKDAKLRLKIVPVKFICKKCKEETEIDDLIFVCPYCGSNDLELIQGRETFIESIEGEKRTADNNCSQQDSIIDNQLKINKQRRVISNEK